MIRTALVVPLLMLVAAVMFAQAPPPAPAPTRAYIGVLPVFDASGEMHGELFCRHLTWMIYDELRKSSLNVEPMLLNPGGVYNPISPDWYLDYSKTAGVDGVIVATLQTADKPKKGTYGTLKVDMQLVRVSDGHASSTYTSSAQIEKRYLDDVEMEHQGLFFSTGSSRPYEKQPIGKVARSMAQDIVRQALAAANILIDRRSAPAVVSHTGTCPVDFRFNYTSKKAISKVFTLIINDRELSLTAKDGIVNTDLPAGPVIVQGAVNDAPYKLPVQHWYQANTYLDCDQAKKDLALDIGPAGEAYLDWH